MYRVLFFYLILLSCNRLTRKVPSWNIIIYQAADNDLFEHAKYTVCSSIAGYIDRPGVNVFFISDGINKQRENSKSEGGIYRLEKGGLKKLIYIGEMNSGSFSVLENNLFYILNNFKADYDCIFLWGHGGGIEVMHDEPNGKINSRKFLSDTTAHSSGSSISVKEFITVINRISQNLDKKIDILGLDACSMMYVEIGYELKDSVNYLIGSQIKQNGLSWNYLGILNFICKNRNINPLDIVKVIRSSYEEFYTEGINHLGPEQLEKRKNDAISGIDLSYVEEFHNKFRNYLSIIYPLFERLDFCKDFRKDVTHNSKVIEAELDIVEHLAKITHSPFLALDIRTLITLSYDLIIEKYSSFINKEALNKIYLDLLASFDKLIVFNYSREKQLDKTKSLEGLSIRNLIDKNGRFIEYHFAKGIWEELLTKLSSSKVKDRKSS